MRAHAPLFSKARLIVRCVGALLAICSVGDVLAAIRLQPQWLTTVPASECPYPSDWSPPHVLHGSQDATLLRSRQGLIRIERDGTIAWDIPACPGCLDPSPRDGEIADQATDSDGTTWITERLRNPAEPYHFAYLAHRLDAGGNIVLTVPLPASDEERSADIGMSVVSATALVAMFTTRPRGGWFWQQVGWVRVDAAGVTQHNAFDAEFAMQASIVALHALPDGDVIAAIERRNNWYCAPLLPCDDAARLLLLRIAADGSERWRIRADDLMPKPAFEPDGSAWFVQYGTGLVSISADGVRSQTLPISLQPYEDVYALHGPIDGNLLLVSDHGLRLFDTQGRVRATRLIPGAPIWDDVDWNIDGIAATAAGFLLPRFGACTVATLLDPRSLADRVAFQRPAPCDPEATPAMYATGGFGTPDGAVHLAFVRSGEQCAVAAARFGLPGTPAGGLVFKDDFDTF